MRVHNGAFDVVQIRVVFERALEQTCLLAQLGNVGSVVVGEHVVAQDGVSDLRRSICRFLPFQPREERLYLRCLHQVHFE